MKTYNPLTLLTLLTISTSAFSETNDFDRRDHRHEMKCIKEKWTLLKVEVKSPSNCKVTKPLALKEKLQTYPHINVGPLKVRYWEGSYEMAKHTTKTYRHDYINICTGVTTYSDEESFESVSTKVYDLQNPNLDSSIKESYKLAPMTNTEAKDAFSNLKIECDTVTSEE